MPFSPLGQLASARSSRHPVSHTPSAIRIHAPRRYPCEPNGITHTPSQLYAAKSLRIWLAPSPDVPAVFEASYNTVVLTACGEGRFDAARVHELSNARRGQPAGLDSNCFHCFNTEPLSFFRLTYRFSRSLFPSIAKRE